MGFFQRISNLWRGFLSLWISNIEQENPEAVYEAAINELTNPALDPVGRRRTEAVRRPRSPASRMGFGRDRHPARQGAVALPS